ncbi:MAG TPA: JAB domain-containing protein [Puia sp.]|jgi:DNA repair protein RadC
MPTKKQRLAELKGDWTASELSIVYKPGEKLDTTIISATEIIGVVRSLWNKELINVQEQMMAFFLNSRGKVIGYRLMAIGDMERAIIDVRLLACLALHTLASSVILAHNHPSGHIEPSNADIDLTKKVKQALQLINVKLLDHIIITESDSLSLANRGLV